MALFHRYCTLNTKKNCLRKSSRFRCNLFAHPAESRIFPVTLQLAARTWFSAYVNRLIHDVDEGIIAHQVVMDGTVGETNHGTANLPRPVANELRKVAYVGAETGRSLLPTSRKCKMAPANPLYFAGKRSIIA